jgi:uncharacterized Zn-finger protein
MMLDNIEVCYVEGGSAVCDGGCGVLGHPKVYMAIDHTGRVTCSYCGRLFVRNPERAGQCEMLSSADASALVPSARSESPH